VVVFDCFVTSQRRWCNRWCILLFDLLEFFFVFVTAHIVHLAQFAQLSQGQACFAQVAQPRLTVVLADILIGFGLTLIDFVEYHASIY